MSTLRSKNEVKGERPLPLDGFATVRIGEMSMRIPLLYGKLGASAGTAFGDDRGRSAPVLSGQYHSSLKAQQEQRPMLKPMFSLTSMPLVITQRTRSSSVSSSKSGSVKPHTLLKQGEHHATVPIRCRVSLASLWYQ